MRLLYAIIAGLVILASGCASQPPADTALDGVPVLAGSSGHPLLPERVFKQLVAKNRKVLGQARSKVHSLAEGLPVAKASSTLPITAAAEQNGWFFYANATFVDSNTQQPVGLISGVAVKRGGREIVGWSIW